MPKLETWTINGTTYTLGTVPLPTAADAGKIPRVNAQGEIEMVAADVLDELPVVTASDNGKFLRVVNGAWAAQAVQSAESNSFGGGA